MTDSSTATTSMHQGMFNPETHYSIRVVKEVNGFPILTGYILISDSAGMWLNWHVNQVVKKVYVPFTNISHIEERGY